MKQSIRSKVINNRAPKSRKNREIKYEYKDTETGQFIVWFGLGIILLSLIIGTCA